VELGEDNNTIRIVDAPCYHLPVGNTLQAPIAYRWEMNDIPAKYADDAWNMQHSCRQDSGNTLSHYPKTLRCAERSLCMILPDPPKEIDDLEEGVIFKQGWRVRNRATIF
jgi:hypothetical protein